MGSDWSEVMSCQANMETLSLLPRAGQCILLDLPDHVLYKIIENLDLFDILRWKCVSKHSLSTFKSWARWLPQTVSEVAHVHPNAPDGEYWLRYGPDDGGAVLRAYCCHMASSSDNDLADSTLSDQLL